MKINSEIQKAKKFMTMLNEHIIDLSISNYPLRNHLSARYFAIACDHHHAIVVLMQNERFASSFALLRILHESFTKGLWVFKCASDCQIEEIYKDNLGFPSQNCLVNKIKNTPEAFDLWPDADDRKNNWGIMNELTHTGMLHLKKWDRSDSTIEAGYTDKEILEVLKSAEAIGIYATLSLARLAGSRLIEDNLIELINENSEPVTL